MEIKLLQLDLVEPLLAKKKIDKKAKYLMTQARENKFDYIHGDIGYNYRISNLNAAVGLAQLEKSVKKLKRKNQFIIFIKRIYLII